MTQSNFTGKVHSFFVDDPIYFKKIRLMFCRIEYFYMFINNPELIDKRENLSVDSGLFFGDKTRNFLKLCYKSWNCVINLEIVL